MDADRGFFRAGGVCAALSAVTTFLMWYLPRTYHLADGFEASLALHAQAGYVLRLWVNFAHIFLAIAGYAAAALALWPRSRVLSALGFLWFVLWGFTELLGVTVNIWAVNRTWRAGWEAADAAGREILRANLTGFDAVWDAMFFLLLVAFLLGTLCLGGAAVRGAGWERAVGVLLLLAAPLTITILLDGYAGIRSAGRAVEWAYPILQPVSRGVMGAWLWRRAARPSGAP